MKHFIHPELLAPNVLTFDVEEAIVREFEPLATGPLDKREFATLRPPWKSDIRWISAVTPEAFDTFQSAFDRLAIAERVAPFLDLEQAVRLYSGFIVIRSNCQEPNFHLDWIKTNNEAFTLMTPITANAAGFGLLYRQLQGDVAEYDYKTGEAIVFGDHFVHSTKPGESEQPVALLCFCFGTDKMEHWDKIRATAGYQSRMVRQPDGQFVRAGSGAA